MIKHKLVLLILFSICFSSECFSENITAIRQMAYINTNISAIFYFLSDYQNYADATTKDTNSTTMDYFSLGDVVTVMLSQTAMILVYSGVFYLNYSKPWASDPIANGILFVSVSYAAITVVGTLITYLTETLFHSLENKPIGSLLSTFGYTSLGALVTIPGLVFIDWWNRTLWPPKDFVSGFVSIAGMFGVICVIYLGIMVTSAVSHWAYNKSAEESMEQNAPPPPSKGALLQYFNSVLHLGFPIVMPAISGTLSKPELSFTFPVFYATF